MSTVLVLGATSDIGTAIARKFASSGFAVQLAGRDLSPIRSLALQLTADYKIPASVHPFDASLTGGHAAFFRELSPLPDITVYVIGYMSSAENNTSPKTETLSSPDETDKILMANYTGAVSILNIIAGEYAAAKKGTIIGISSVAGERGRQSNFLYGSAKAGFTAYLSGLRNYLFPHGVHVLTVKPGFVYTKMTKGLTLPPRLTATPEQVATAVCKAAENKKNTIYVMGIWRWIMLAIKMVPEPVFKKLKL